MAKLLKAMDNQRKRIREFRSSETFAVLADLFRGNKPDAERITKLKSSSNSTYEQELRQIIQYSNR